MLAGFFGFLLAGSGYVVAEALALPTPGFLNRPGAWGALPGVAGPPGTGLPSAV